MVNLPSVRREWLLKKENVVCRQLGHGVTILGRTVVEIFFDLRHIHHGWDVTRKDYNAGPARNNYSEEDIVAFFEQLNTIAQTPVPQTANWKTVEHRLVFYVYDEGKKLKMVVDLMKNDSTVVVTVFEI